MEPQKMRVPAILTESAQTYYERNSMYGDNYKLFGEMMMKMFPDGLVLKTPDDFNRFNMFTQCVGKMTRYAQMFDKGGHQDSAHDACVYSAMLQEVTEIASDNEIKLQQELADELDFEQPDIGGKL